MNSNRRAAANRRSDAFGEQRLEHPLQLLRAADGVEVGHTAGRAEGSMTAFALVRPAKESPIASIATSGRDRQQQVMLARTTGAARVAPNVALCRGNDGDGHGTVSGKGAALPNCRSRGKAAGSTVGPGSVVACAKVVSRSSTWFRPRWVTRMFAGALVKLLALE